jgi:hypothetical protein
MGIRMHDNHEHALDLQHGQYGETIHGDENEYETEHDIAIDYGLDEPSSMLPPFA